VYAGQERKMYVDFLVRDLSNSGSPSCRKKFRAENKENLAGDRMIFGSVEYLNKN
jgi:hypothetical protein